MKIIEASSKKIGGGASRSEIGPKAKMEKSKREGEEVKKES